MNKAIITQIIPTIQGEGSSVGTPVLLIRMGNCNLDCEWCDTKWSNNLKPKEVKKFSKKNTTLPFIIDDDNFNDFVDFINKEFLNQYTIHTILLTGGEPTMNKGFVRSITFNSNFWFISKIEIETNGVLLNDEEDYKNFDHWERVIQFNISPKLNPEYYRSDKIKTIDDIIELFKTNYEKSIKSLLEKSPSTVEWKFVYSKDDEKAIDKFIKEVGCSLVYMMPLTPDYTNLSYKNEMDFLEDFRKSSYDTLNYCMRMGYTFTARTHVWVFNNFLHRNELVDVRKEENKK